MNSLNVHTLKIALTLTLFFTIKGEGFGQKLDSAINRNSVEIYFPVKHFFDGSSTNWSILVPAKKYSKNPPEEIYLFPFTFGIKYSRLFENMAGVNISFTAYNMIYYELEVNSKIPGEIVNREFGLVTINYCHPIVIDKRLLIWSKAGVDFRYGNETFHISYPTSFEQIVDGHDIADLGSSIGLKIAKPLIWNIQIGTEISYTRYLYRRDKGNPNYPFDNGTSPNLLTIQLNMGYRF